MTSDDSVYRAPASALEHPVATTERPLEEAIAGRFELDLGAILQEAWDRTKGSKRVILGAALIGLAASLAGNVVTVLVSNPEDIVSGGVISLVVTLVSVAFNYAINAGTYRYAIKRSADDTSASFDDVFSCLPLVLPIFGLMALYALFVGIGFILLVVPGVYLAVGYLFALPLKVERDLGIWEALETSRKAVHHDWFKILAILLVMGAVLGVAGGLTFGIALIWLVPWATLVYAITYREMFGYAGAG